MTRADPPLIMIAEGRRPRLRREPKIISSELALHFSVASLLRRCGQPDWRWTHFPAGEQREPRAAAKLRQMGLGAGWPDFIMIDPTSRFHGLELKRAGGRLSDDQEAFAVWCVRHGVPHAVVGSMAAAVDVLTRWGALRQIGGAR